MIIRDYLPLVPAEIFSHQNFQNDQLKSIANQILSLYSAFYAKFIKEVPHDFVEQIINIYNPIKMFYRWQSTTDYKAVTPFGYELNNHQAQIEWHNTLKVGDIVDCLRDEDECERKCWSRAVVLFINDGSIRVYFLGANVDEGKK